MKQEQFTTIRLIADNNKCLTQSSNDVAINERILANVINLGRNDSPENWKEISIDEAYEIEQAKKEHEEKEYERMRKESEIQEKGEDVEFEEL